MVPNHQPEIILGILLVNTGSCIIQIYFLAGNDPNFNSSKCSATPSTGLVNVYSLRHWSHGHSFTVGLPVYPLNIKWIFPVRYVNVYQRMIFNGHWTHLWRCEQTCQEQFIAKHGKYCHWSFQRKTAGDIHFLLRVWEFVIPSPIAIVAWDDISWLVSLVKFPFNGFSLLLSRL